MSHVRRPSTVLVTTLALLVVSAGGPVLAVEPGARLEGRVVAVDGRPAEGYRVHLIDERGTVVSSAAVRDGQYGFADVPSGRYHLGVESLEGELAPVAGAPVRLERSQLARRDVKLMRADAELSNAALGANYGFSDWWGSLTAAGKTWTIVGVIVGGAIAWSAFDEDNTESNASPEGAR